MPQPSLTPPSFTSGRRWKIGLNVALSSALLLAVAGMVNYLSQFYYVRYQAGKGSRAELSPLTLQLLRSLTNDVKVIVFFDRREPLYGAVAEMLNEYKSRSSRIDLEFVDYIRFRGRAEAVRAQYRLEAEGGDRIIFESQGRIKVAHEKDLSEFDYSAVLEGREVRRVAFKGEQIFTSALHAVIDPKPVKAYFVQGHGEHDPAGKEDLEGYASFARMLEEANIVWERLDLARAGEAPPDCQLLILAGPLRPFSREEAESIHKYLSQGGRLLGLFNIHSVNQQLGLEWILAEYGIEVGRNYVTDALQSRSGDNQQLIVGQFGNHPIMKPLLNSRLALIRPRSVTPSEPSPRNADSPKVVELAMTSSEGAVRKNAGRPERTGVIPLMAAVERGSIQGIRANRGAARMVIVGESFFAGNFGMEMEANADFARNAVNWLLNREVLLEGIGPRAVKEYRITMTETQMKTARWAMLGFVPGGVLLAGVMVWLRRRS